ncbi:hypothetical protein Taro_055792 [Colocasia esculenta]|uniref:Uncharacterized protein n=1 Tax=Colocasia esculenta TaxID=4460 RepID=A0A843XVB7_COLES|nr:hypothetical protein [Colocasia esculenta]
MELQWQSLSLLFTFFLLLLILTRKAATGDPPKRLPPGPKPLPIIGCIHHLLTSLPHRRLRDLAGQYGPLMHLKLGQVSTVVVSSPQVATEVMKTHDLVFCSRPEILAAKVIGYGCTDVVFAPYGEYWRQLRKICILELLSAKRVQSFRRVREEEVDGLVLSIRAAAGGDQKHHREVINLTQKLYALSSSIASRAAFGKKCLRHERFLATVREAVKLASGFNVADLFPSLDFINVVSGMKFKLEKVRQRLDGILDEILEEHKSKNGTRMQGVDGRGLEEEDLLDVLLRIQEKGDLEFSLTNDNIKAVILVRSL